MLKNSGFEQRGQKAKDVGFYVGLVIEATFLLLLKPYIFHNSICLRTHNTMSRASIDLYKPYPICQRDWDLVVVFHRPRSNSGPETIQLLTFND